MTERVRIKTTDKRRVKLNAAYCLNCSTYLVSKHQHDWKACKCFSKDTGIFIDGGFDYIRQGGNMKHMRDLSEYYSENEEPCSKCNAPAVKHLDGIYLCDSCAERYAWSDD